MSALAEIAPDLLKIITDVLGKVVLPNVFSAKPMSIQFNNYGSEGYDLWYAVGDRFEFIGRLKKGEMHLNFPKEKAGGVIVVTNGKKTKFSMIAPLRDFVAPLGDVTPSKYRVGTYYVEVNPEDAAIWVHYKASRLGANGTELYEWGVKLEIEKLRESVECPWRNDFSAVGPYLRDDVAD